MFGRSSDESVAPVQSFADSGEQQGGRSAAISILPGVPLPADLVQAPVAPAQEESFDAPDERELVSVGAGQHDAAQAAGGSAVEAPVAPPAPAKRKSFSALRRRDKAAPEAPEGFFGPEGDAPTPATAFAPPAPDAAVTFPDGFDAPHADSKHVNDAHEAHVVTEVHVVSEHPIPVEAPVAHSVPTSFHPTAPASPIDDVAMFPSTMPADEPATFNPTALNIPAEPAEPAEAVAAPVAPEASLPPVPPVVAPSVAAPTVAAPTVAAPAAIVEEDPLFLHVPVLTGDGTVATAAPAAPAAAAARPSFLDRLRGLRPVGVPAAPTTEPDAATATDAPPPFVAPVAGAIQPPPYVPFTPPDSAAPAPAYVPLGAPAQAAPPAYVPEAVTADTPAAPPVEAGAPIPAFGNLVPSHSAYPDAPAAEAPAAPAGPTIGLVFADGSHAELPDGPEGAALQHVANVLAGEDTTAGTDTDTDTDGQAAPIE